jgi:hypothetical protein
MASPDSLLALTNLLSKYQFGYPGFGGMSSTMVDYIPNPQNLLPANLSGEPITRYGEGDKSITNLINSPASKQVKGLDTATKVLGVAGTVASFIPPLAPIGIGLNIAATALGLGRAIKSYSDADKMTSPKLPAPEEVRVPDIGVSAADYASQQSGLKSLYTSTIRAGQVLGKDLSTGALAQTIEAERQQAAQNAEVNRRAKELGVNIEQFNTQQYQQWARDKAGLDWQTEAMKAGIKSEAVQTGIQGVLNLGQNFVTMGNVANSFASNLEQGTPDLVTAYTEAITSGTPEGASLAVYIENLMKERQKKIDNPWSLYGFGKGKI